MAVMIIGVITTSVLTVMNQCIAAAIDLRTNMQAFEIVRNNMETLLAENKLAEKIEFGISETNPDIQWETLIETFTEPITDSMWLQAACSATYTDQNGEFQTVKLKHWLSEISPALQKKLADQEKKERELMGDSAKAIIFLEKEYKKNLANALGIDPADIKNIDIADMEQEAEQEGLDLGPMGKDELDNKIEKVQREEQGKEEQKDPEIDTKPKGRVEVLCGYTGEELELMDVWTVIGWIMNGCPE